MDFFLLHLILIYTGVSSKIRGHNWSAILVRIFERIRSVRARVEIDVHSLLLDDLEEYINSSERHGSVPQ